MHAQSVVVFFGALVVACVLGAAVEPKQQQRQQQQPAAVAPEVAPDVEKNREQHVEEPWVQRMNQLETEMRSLKTAVAANSVGAQRSALDVAFFARHSGGVLTLSVGQTLVWGRTVTNIGDRYNPSSGTFRAPYTGFYVFNVFFQNNRSSDSDLAVMVNGVAACKADARYDREQASCTAVVRLVEGDVVDVQGIEKGAQLEPHADDHGFSGFLYALD